MYTENCTNYFITLCFYIAEISLQLTPLNDLQRLKIFALIACEKLHYKD